MLLTGSLEIKLLTCILEDRPQQHMEVAQVTGKETAQCWYISKYPKVSDYKRFIFKTSEIQNSAFGLIWKMSTPSLSPLQTALGFIFTDIHLNIAWIRLGLGERLL